jgi:hypothetical protein
MRIVNCVLAEECVKYQYSSRIKTHSDSSNRLNVNSKAHLKRLMVFMRVHKV